jgi:hypothetical protein
MRLTQYLSAGAKAVTKIDLAGGRRPQSSITLTSQHEQHEGHTASSGGIWRRDNQRHRSAFAQLAIYAEKRLLQVSLPLKEVALMQSFFFC